MYRDSDDVADAGVDDAACDVATSVDDDTGCRVGITILKLIVLGRSDPNS